MKKSLSVNDGAIISLESPNIERISSISTSSSLSSSLLPEERKNLDALDSRRGRHKLKIIMYKYGGGGAQDGAQDGPDNLRFPSKFQTNRPATNLSNDSLEDVLTDYDISFHNPIPDHITNQNSHPDASFVTRISAKSGQIKHRIQAGGGVVRKMVKIDEGNTVIKKYQVTTFADGSVDVPDRPYASKLVDEIKSRPPEIDKKGKTIFYPNGIKNFPYVEGAVENTAAAVCHEILNSQLAANISTNNIPPLVLGGDHTQGLATNVGARLAAVTIALLSENEKERIPLSLSAGQNRESVLLEVRKKANDLRAQESQPDILQAAHALGKSINFLIDENVFKEIRNEQLYNDVKNELKRQGKNASPLEMRLAIASKRQQRLNTLDDKGVLSMTELKKFMSTIHEFWFDAHGDWNTEVTSSSKNAHGMPLAFASGHGVLSDILGTAFLELDPENTHTFGTRDTDADERTLMKQVGVDINRSKEIQDAGKRLKDVSKSATELLAHQREWGLAQLFNEKCAAISQQVRVETGREAQFIVSYDGDGIHATGDTIDEHVFSDEEKMNAKGFAATGTPVSKGGPRTGHALKAVEGLHTKYKVLAYDFSEFNPNLGIAQNTNLSDDDKLALLKKNPSEDGSVETTREVSLAFIKSMYAKKRTPVPGAPPTLDA